ncbi:MAG TPA: peptide ABC transporter substrate-binding protein [Tepidisphaeraceae bacterium]|jgi:oligopeptide transport system substrate-binding protein
MPRRALWPIFLLLLVAVSCDRRSADDTAVFRFINRGDIITLDLNQMSYVQDFRITYAIREGLYAPAGPDFTPVPAGATSAEVSPDQRTYTFRLRPDARWSNGDPVTADDYLFSWKLMLDTPGEYTYLFYCIEGAKAYEEAVKADPKADFSQVAVRAIDRHTLRVTLSSPVPYFLDLAAFPPFYPRHEPSMRAFKFPEAPGYDAKYTRPPAVVTNGPFVLSDWQFKKVLRLDRNPHYWDAANVKLTAIENVINDNTLSQYLQFEAGAVQFIADVPAEVAPELREQKHPGFTTATAFGTAFLSLNTRPTLPGSDAKNPLADVRVRQALAMTIDKTFITEGITRLGEQVATTYIPPGTLPGYHSAPGLAYDVAKAKALLAEAGYPDGRGFPKLPVLFNSENQTRARIAQALKQQWKQALGIDVEVDGIEGKIFKERNSTKNFVISTVAWYGDYPDVSTFTDKYLASSLNNDSDYQSKAYNDLLTQAALEPDVEKRFEQLRQAEHLLNTEVPIIPMYHYVNAALIGPKVRGLSVNARNLMVWKDVSLEP